MNFVFFFPDEMKASSVSSYGNRRVKMPNFDKLSREGIRFENCIVQNPVCSPSRCSLMTGLYVHNRGHRSLWHLLRKPEESLFRYLKNDGYDIGWFGKNDLYSQNYLKEICTDIDEKRTGYQMGTTKNYGKVKNSKNPYSLKDPLYYSFLYDEIKVDNQDLIYDENIARGIDFLKNRKKNDKPFFLFLPTGMPHPPYATLEGYHNMYSPEECINDLIKKDIAQGKPEYMSLIRKNRKLDKLEQIKLAKIHSVYLGMNSYVDTMLGELLKTLKETGLDKETTIIVSSDHGDWAGNHGLVEKWPNAMDDDLVKVPLIIKGPTLKSGHVVNEQVELFDIMPTVLELAGIEAKHTHFARSLMPQLKGAKGDPERLVFCEGGYDIHEPHLFEGYEKRVDNLKDPKNIYYPKIIQQLEIPSSVCRSTMIRSLNYKLIKRTSNENELYDLKKDPKELKNVYDDINFKNIKLYLENEMLNWYLKTSDTTPMNDDIRGF